MGIQLSIKKGLLVSKNGTVSSKPLFNPDGQQVGIYSGTIKDYMPHGNGVFVYDKDGEKYEGSWENGQKHGFGRISYANGNFYEGEIKNNCVEGSGEIAYSNGEKYVGEWKNAKRYGRGKFTWPNGEVYDGEWLDDKRNGNGKMTYARDDIKGYVYEGGWKNNECDGFGVLSTSSGSVFYEGEWKEGKRFGKGKSTWDCGAVYIGGFKDNARHGKGKYTRSNGEIYEGNWENGEMKGDGKCIWPDGTIYEGEFENGIIKGRGRRSFSNGDYLDGVWFNQENFIEGKVHINTNKLSFTGTVENNFSIGEDGLLLISLCYFGIKIGKLGEGKMIFPNGSEFIFESDGVECYGVCKYSDGSQYKGYMWDPSIEGDYSRIGKGEFTDAENIKKVGYWLNDVCITDKVDAAIASSDFDAAQVLLEQLLDKGRLYYNLFYEELEDEINEEIDKIKQLKINKDIPDFSATVENNKDDFDDFE